jgi:phytoene dehydrogenase-like protein
VSGADLLCFLLSLPKLYQHSFFERHGSVGEAVDALTRNATLRQLGYVLSGVSGVSPYRLPSHYLEMGKRVIGTVVGNPVHFVGGNRQVADRLVGFIRLHGGQLAFQEKVEQILWKGSSDFRIVTDRGEYTCDFVISNAGIKTTILDMTSPALWDKSFWAEVEALKTTLQVINIFLTLSPSQAFPPGYGAFFAATDPVQEFALLEKGQFPEQSMFILQVPTNLEKEPVPYHQATLQFYCPRGEVSPQALDQQARHVMTEGLDNLFAGLSQQVIDYQVYNPIRYEREFGLKPFVFGISPDICNRRYGLQTPRERLFCVGDSVQPERPSVAQAMESGILCAQEIVRRKAGLQHGFSSRIKA